MPNCDFFASGDDHRAILEHIFDNLPCRLFELSSRFDCELAEFTSLSDVERHFGIDNWSSTQRSSLLLAIYAADANGRLNFRRIALDSTKCDGATFRFSCHGWGLPNFTLNLRAKVTSETLTPTTTLKSGPVTGLQRTRKWVIRRTGTGRP